MRCVAELYALVYVVLVLHSTIVIEPGCKATITEYGDIEIMVCYAIHEQCHVYKVQKFMLTQNVQVFHSAGRKRIFQGSGY